MADGGVHNIRSKAEWTTALEDSSPLLLDCMATWCGPCKVIAPKIVDMSKEFPNIRFYKLDVDEVPDLAQELGIRAMPTFLVFNNKQKVGEVVGANEKAIRNAVVTVAA